MSRLDEMDGKAPARRLAEQLYRNLLVLAVLTLVFVLVLALAPLKWHNAEWKDAQKGYNLQAAAAGLRPMTIGLKQIWRPEAGLTDRCTSCHVGMGASAPLPIESPLYGRHPDVGHDVARMGCTICHLGQGRATTMEAAHGDVEHWESPMLPGRNLQASCGGCHGEAARIPPLTQIDRGEYLFELHGCNACHVVDGKGGSVGPDLSGVALKGFDREWHILHLREPTAVVEGSRMMSFGHLTDREIDDILAYLDTLIGAPDMIRGKAIAVELGCRGCHKIGGLGGDVSVDLDEALSKPISEYDFTHIEGPHTREGWHREHLRDPQRVAPGSTMPAYRLPEDQEEALLTYILSLRRAPVSLEDLPPETVLARLEQRRDFASDGASLYGVFCAACHGTSGSGQPMASLGTTVPGLENPDVLNIMSPASLRYILENGRPGRFMPAWGSGGAGLTDSEIDTLIEHLRRDLPQPPPLEEVMAAGGSLVRGARVFRNDCAACHGEDREGTVIAPSLDSPEFRFLADEKYLYRTVTRGRAGTAMPAHPHYDAGTLASLIFFIREDGTRGSAPDRRRMTAAIRDALGVDRLEEYRASGSPAYGGILFDSMCAACHGPRGRGMIGPGIGNRDFLRTATDAFIAGNIVLGRSGKAMRSFGSHGLVNLAGREIGDIIAYLRQVGSEPVKRPGFASAQGDTQLGIELFGRYCAGCHGREGEGLTAPSLRNPAFLAAVSDGFIQATLVRGRPGTAMRSWARGGFGFAELSPEEINAITATIRSWEPGTSKPTSVSLAYAQEGGS